MASRVQIVLVDDIDGGDADVSIEFGLDGVDYEIDLSDENAAALRTALAPYIQAARRSPGGRGSRRRRSAAAGAKDSRSAQIRSWARSNGIEVNARGRIPAELVARYEAAQR